MKNVSIASVALLATTSLFLGGAYGADLSQQPVYKAPVMVQPVYNWTGCYVGGNIGADWGRSDVTAANTGSGISWTNSGFIGGGQIGCDYQFYGHFVIGARNMLEGTTLNSGATFNGGPAAGYTANSDTSWVDLLTARIGYTAMPELLIYFQGGAAWTRNNAYISAPNGAQVGQVGGNRSGWTIGGGLEWMFAPHWSTFLEYNYMDFGTTSGTAMVNNVSYPLNFQQDGQAVLVGVNYRF